MKFIDLEQRTDAWKAWRREGITATDSPVILGACPYKTPWRLWAEKTGRLLPPDLSGNPNVRYGIEHEDDARRIFEMRHAVCAMPACGEWDEDPVFRASFDGLTPELEPLEIKCPSPSTLEDVRMHGLASDAVRMYVVQLQHQMLVAGAQRGWLAFYDGPNDDVLEFEVSRDEALIARIVKEGQAFHQLLLTEKAPPKDPKRDVFVPEDESDREAWLRAAQEFLALDAEIRRHQAKIDRLTAERRSSQETMKRLMGSYAAADFGGVSVRKCVVRGRLDAEKLVETALHRKPTEAEIAACRSPESERWLFKAAGSASEQTETTAEAADLPGDAETTSPSTFYF